MLRIPRAVLGAALLAGIATVGAAQQGAAGKGAQTRAERMEGRRGPRDAMRGLLRGIDLSQRQQEQVKAINERHAGQLQELRKANRPDMEKMRAAREKGDTAAMRVARQEMASERQRTLAITQQASDEVRAVLTADQQKTFDANRAAIGKRGEKRGERPGDRDAWAKGGRKPGRR
ncbi:MAG: Spy/CpxP family protein refolding chaperone [Gemmatimonadaceae bacterium]